MDFLENYKNSMLLGIQDTSKESIELALKYIDSFAKSEGPTVLYYEIKVSLLVELNRLFEALNLFSLFKGDKKLLSYISQEYKKDSLLASNVEMFTEYSRLHSNSLEKGMKMPNAKLRLNKNGERSIIAFRNIEKNALILNIPISMMLIQSNLRESPEILPYTKLIPSLYYPDKTCISLYIISNKWEFFNLLPKSLPFSPVFYNPEELKLLEGSIFNGKFSLL